MALTTTVSGCADVLSRKPVVRLAVPWSGSELRAFQKVLDSFPEDLEYRVVVIPLGDDIQAAFDRTGQRIDVVMLPRPGLVKVERNRLRLKSIAGFVDTGSYGPVWNDLLGAEQGGDGYYGLPFKIAHKSMVWYRKSVLDRCYHEFPTSLDFLKDHGFPRRWSQWRYLNKILSYGRVAPLALAGADDWMLTDFFENVLLGCAPTVYNDLAGAAAHVPRLSTYPEEVAKIKQALRLVGRMWTVPGTLAGGVRRCLVTQFEDAVTMVFGHRTAAMVVAPDFAEPVIRQLLEKDEVLKADDVGVFPFPRIDGDCAEKEEVFGLKTSPLIFGGDVAVPLEINDHVEDLIKRLADPRVAEPWIKERGGGFLPAQETGPISLGAHEFMGYRERIEDLYKRLRTRKAADEPVSTRLPPSIQFDLSDRLGPLGDSGSPLGDSRRLGRVLQDFLMVVGNQNRTGDDVSDAADRAIAQLQGPER